MFWRVIRFGPLALHKLPPKSHYFVSISNNNIQIEGKKKKDLWEQTWGMYSNNGVKNRRAQPMRMPVTIPDKPVFAPLSLFTADLEKEPAWQVRKINPH